MKITFCVLIALGVTIEGYTQNNTPVKAPAAKKGNTDSDIRFKGQHYDFTLKKVVATDRQTAFDPAIYFNPVKLTIPQTNFRIGYFFKDHYSISLAFDHMKYVMRQDQRVKMSGTISESGTEYDGTYDNEEIVLASDFLQYENTDGLNYVNVELGRHDRLIAHQGQNGKDAVGLWTVEGVSAGFMFPRTDSHLLNNRRNNEYHVAGYGTSLKVGLRLELFSYFFIQSEVKGGYINMPNLRPTEFASEKAQQHFLFFQTNLLFGLTFPLPQGSKKSAEPAFPAN
jgi:hypothetical protein